jgi:hypothetical protein
MLRPMTFQTLRLTLDGMTAGDYLAHLYDPEPPALGLGLRSVAVRGEPLGDVVEALLCWDGPAVSPHRAARLAGFPLPGEVVALESRRLQALDDDCAQAA